MLAFLNRHLPLTEAQRSQFRQSQALPHSQTTSGASVNASDNLATTSQHMPSVEDQGKDRGQQTANHVDQRAPVHDTGLQPGQVVLDGLSDGLSDGTALTGRTFDSRVKPEEHGVFESICKGNIAILDLSL